MYILKHCQKIKAYQTHEKLLKLLEKFKLKTLI